MNGTGSKTEVLTAVKAAPNSYPDSSLEHSSIERARALIVAEVEAAPGAQVVVSAYGSFSSRDGVDVAHSCSISVSSS
jgi:hypothetical protein